MKLRSFVTAAWIATYVTLMLCILWSRHLETPYLIMAALSWGVAVGLLLRSRLDKLLASCLGLLALLLCVQLFTTWRLQRLATDWEQVVAARQSNMRALLDRRVTPALQRAMQTALLAGRSGPTSDTIALFRRLEALRAGSKVDAIAVFGENGELVAWAGEHRAQLPEAVRFGISGVDFVEQPLYSYIYFPAQIRNSRQHVVTMVLVGATLHGTDESDLTRVAKAAVRTGATFHRGKGGPDSWPVVVNGDTVAHGVLAPISQTEWRDNAIRLMQQFELVIAAIVMVLLGITWLRRRGRRFATTVPLLAATLALGFAPIKAFGLEEIFKPELFVLPRVPGDITLGALLCVLVTLAALAASVQESKRPPRLPTLLLVIGAIAVAVGYPGAIRLLIGPSAATSDPTRAATPDLLLGGNSLWFGLQIAAVLLLAIITEFALPRWKWSSPLPWLMMLVGALLTSAALSVLVLMLGQTKRWVSPWAAAAWALPFLLTAFAISAHRGGGVRYIRWLMAGWLAASAVLPYIWVAHVDARLQTAERDLRSLGSNPDPFLDFQLMQLAKEARVRANAGETGMLFLYRTWVSSGLARESYPARLTLWSKTGVPEQQLTVYSNDPNVTLDPPLHVPPYLEAAFTRVREHPDSIELMRVQADPNVTEALILSPDSLQTLTVEVPPRRTLQRPDIPYIGVTTHEAATVELVPAKDELPPKRYWVPTLNGWRSETLVHFADGDYHAHMDVQLPRLGVQIARGVLLLAVDLLLFTLLWLMGRAARGEHLALLKGWRDWRGSFRARVTATLFFFFLIPTAVFGAVAFSALANEVARATRIVAERATQEAVSDFQVTGGDLRLLSQRVNGQVLYYFGGELARSSSPEARELGVYGAWLPPDVYLALTHGDEDAAVRERTISGQQVLTAYRSLVPANSATLGIPMSLASGDTAARQRELSHLIMFSALIGLLLSLLLSVIVGRALTGPIHRLQNAAAKVGAGNLRIKLPENTGDEFGQLFASFNQMVRRLRRARTQQARSARVLAWGEMARQVAHEIKNPLTPIKLAVQHLKRAYYDGKTNYPEVLDRNVEQILLEIDRLSEIARAFSRYGAPTTAAGPLELVDVGQVVHEALTLYRASDPQVDYRENVETNVPRALARAGELKEVLLNLVENAHAAIDGAGGRIEVAARSSHEHIEIVVSDDGPGIPADFLPRVFDPHFSTRTTGTGLGLAIVRRLVESWGGTVTAESQVGVGTSIVVMLRKAV